MSEEVVHLGVFDGTDNRDIVEKLATRFDKRIVFPCEMSREAARVIESLRSEVDRLRLAHINTQNEIQQSLGKALGCPPLYPDASEVDDGQVCVGDHVAESLAAEAARTIAELRSQVDILKRGGC